MGAHKPCILTDIHIIPPIYRLISLMFSVGRTDLICLTWPCCLARLLYTTPMSCFCLYNLAFYLPDDTHVFSFLSFSRFPPIYCHLRSTYSHDVTRHSYGISTASRTRIITYNLPTYLHTYINNTELLFHSQFPP